MELKRAHILILFISVLFSASLLHGQWYRDYELALQRLGDGRYEEALEKINQAIAREGKPQARKKAQSNRYISYFPYLARGTINYYLGNYAESLKDLQTSKSYGEVFLDADGNRQWYQFNDWALIKMSGELMKEGLYWFNSGDYEKARQGFARVIQADSSNTAARLFLKIIQGMQQEDFNNLRLESKSSFELEEGKKLLEKGLYQEAIIRFSIALALDSTLAEAEIFRQRAESSLDRIKVRLAGETRLTEEQKLKTALLDTLNIGLAAYTRGDYRTAEEILQLVHERDPGNTVAAEFLERCRQESKLDMEPPAQEPEKPAEEAKRTLEETETNEEVLALQSQLDSVSRQNVVREQSLALMEELNRGLDAFAQGRYENAVEIMEEVLKQDPGLTVAAQYLELGHKALDESQKITDEQRDTLSLRMTALQSQIAGLAEESRRQRAQLDLLNQVNTGAAALSLGEYERAIALFQEVLKDNPELATAKNFLALAQQQERQSREMETISREFQTVQGEYQRLKARMDSVAESSYRHEQEIALMEKLNSGLLAFANNDYQTAVVFLEGALQEDPELTTAREYLKKAREALTKPPGSREEVDTLNRDLRAGIDSLQDQLSSVSENYRSQQRQLANLKRTNEGLRALSRQEYGQAITLFRAVLEENPDNALVGEYLALAEQQYSSSREAEKAKESLTERIKSEMEEGTALISSGNYQEAMLHFNVVQALDPGNVAAGKYAEQVKNALDRIELQRKMIQEQNLESAKKMETRQKLLSDALTCFIGQRFGDAQNILKNALTSFPEDKQAQDLLAESERALEREREEVRTTEIFSKYKQSGMEYFTRGDFEKARDNLLVASAMDPENEELKSSIAQCEINLSKGKAGTFFYLSALKRGMTVVSERLTVDGVAFNQSGISQIEIKVNGNKSGEIGGTQTEAREENLQLAFNYPVKLREGMNRVVLIAHAPSGVADSTVIDSISYLKLRGKVWAVLIGVEEYLKVTPLNYTVDDVYGFRNVLEKMGIDSSQIFSLTNSEVTARQIRTLLGSRLREMAQPEDQVIIYFSGHGGYEADEGGNNADGFEKYLLPYDADPNNYYATAYPMSDIANISARLKAGQVFFVIDACYSGASDSKSFVQAGGANFSAEFLDRLSSRNGRIVLTASGPNEPSLEWDAKQHGVFTYFLLEGLKGAADINGDQLVSINELNEYLAVEVRKATNDRQHPIYKGSSTGLLYLGRIVEAVK